MKTVANAGEVRQESISTKARTGNEHKRLCPTVLSYRHLSREQRRPRDTYKLGKCALGSFSPKSLIRFSFQ